MTKKVIFFTAGEVPTADELEAIATLNAMAVPGYQVAVRNGSQNAEYGEDRLEPCDFVAGTLPTAYSDELEAETPAFADFGDVGTGRPLALKILPATVSISGTNTEQLQVVAVEGTTASDVDVTDVTSGCTYASSATSKATVNASTGLVTGVAAGTTVITATYTYDTDKTITATRTVTVTA